MAYGLAGAIWCLCQTLMDLMLQYNLFIQNADCCKRAERLYGVVDLAAEEKLSSHRCSMTSSRECYLLHVTQWNAKPLYLAVSDMYRFSLGCVMLVKTKNTLLFENQKKNWRGLRQEFIVTLTQQSGVIGHIPYHSIKLFTSDIFLLQVLLHSQFNLITWMLFNFI